MNYFDWAATSLPNKKILQEALDISIEYSANPSGVHKKSIEAKKKIDEARKRCAQVLDVQESAIIFTSGGTESNYIPIVTLLQRPSTGSILVSSIEHSAVKEQALSMERCGWKVIPIPVNKNGIIEPQTVVEKLQDDTALVCIMGVNNEMGSIQPIKEINQAITEACKGKKKPKIHVDTVQTFGKIPFSLRETGVDTATISTHKLCGPRGIGILYMKDRQEPFLRGGGQESGIRSGTENLFGIWATMLCLEEYVKNENLLKRIETQKTLMNYFISELHTIKNAKTIPDLRGTDEIMNSFSPWVLQASFKGLPGEVMVRSLSEKGFYISTGSACSSRKAVRPVLQAMGIDKEIATNTVRFSFGPNTTKADIDGLLSELRNICTMFN